MSNDDITRFELVITQAGNYLKSHPDGDWVSFDAHAEAVKAAYLAGLEAAKGKCHNHCENRACASEDALHHGEYRVHEDMQCEARVAWCIGKAIDQLIKETKQ